MENDERENEEELSPVERHRDRGGLEENTITWMDVRNVK